MHEVLNQFSCNILSPSLLETLSFLKIYLFWNMVHYSSCHLYYNYCVPSKWYYSFFTPFYNETPLCKGLNWFYKTSTQTISSISATMITWSSKIIFNSFNYKQKNI